jgi:hypothetical protein
MVGDFERCLRIYLERIHRTVAVGQAPASDVIHMIGRCFLRLSKFDELEKHKQQYPNEDWDQLQEKEEKQTRGGDNSSIAY